MLKPGYALLVSIVFLGVGIYALIAAYRHSEQRGRTLYVGIALIVVAGITSIWWIGQPLDQ